MNKVVVIAGPTASGKSGLAVELAKKINGEIISADSVQVYKYMDIGSAKVTEEEMQGIKHYLVDEFYPNEDFNVSVFVDKGIEYINEILSKGKVPIIVGGSGLYVDALIYDSYDFEEENSDKSYREYLENLAKENGKQYVYDMLVEADKESADEIHPNNLKRVIRALEIYKKTGKKKSDRKERKKEYRFKDTYYFCLNDNREKLYEKIDKRVDEMISLGLVDEVKSLLHMGYDESLNSMRALGYKEIVSFLKGDISLEQAIYIIKRDTRHFAKRQLTWFRHNEDVIWLSKEDYKDTKDILTFMRGIINE
ncbi:tRNA (adenosine(37)-N6)-dimethylallyltransferase MiaA [Anaerofustis stercorihominis]|uniref:tRNA (adenosine(37)-N6)-dimethylallyltransferase MiaA n=1 Tax=Anaerofustis stercorihominis TaxID=214853 RepID=UPI00214CF861|nr:tRNA (adenosine(37)-N6)-dimethylallyltransferase MiaA [Anaerofustis stercorihominis]MCR2032319.1 tRNA (adenosine(37)-N6)-dimethylallyltransferase MiaA [Anaerofustis stercorihominis]